MRRSMVLLPWVALMCGCAAVSERNAAPRTISVAGTVETKTAPDHVVWRISLRDVDKDLRQAKARNDAKAKSVVALRKTLGIGEGDLETGHISIRREYERTQHGHRGDFKHFVVTRSVTIRQRELKRFDEFLDALVSSADMEVSFRFESSCMRDVRAETRLEALRMAREKARAMAEAAGATLGRALTINEHAQDGRWRGIGSNAAVVHSTPSVDAASDRFVPGAISVRVTVYATFELE